jgi:hypothetical protein
LRSVKPRHVATREAATVGRRPSLGLERRRARRAHRELAEAGSARANLLLVGSEQALACLLDSLRPRFRHPVSSWRSGQALVLPRALCGGTLILRDVGAMTRGQQATLYDWLSEVRDTQVVSTSRTPVWPEVQLGRFMAALYYRLNRVVIDMA